MQILTLDFETYWTADYTLKKLTTEAYIRDPRFHTHMVGLKNRDGKSVVVPHHLIPSVFSKIDWSDTAVLCQHAHFDCAILSWIYGVRPAFILDTLSMFRALYPAESAALANIVRVLGLPDKGAGYSVMETRGVRHLSPEQYQRCATYCGLDCDLTWQVFNRLRKDFPGSELQLIDLVVRMFTEPVLELHEPLLQEAYEDELEAKRILMERVDFDKDSLSSNPKFARILLDLGIDPPKKLSPAKVKRGDINPETEGEAPIGLIPEKTPEWKAHVKELKAQGEEVPLHISDIWSYAFGKNDESFKRLLEHDDPMIAALMEARFGVKSTIKETRAQRFIGIAQRGAFPIYLKYYGGHTGRFGGGDKANPQNLNRACPNPNCDGGKIVG